MSPFVYAHHVVCALESENGEVVTLEKLLPDWWGMYRYKENSYDQ